MTHHQQPSRTPLPRRPALRTWATLIATWVLIAATIIAMVKHQIIAVVVLGVLTIIAWVTTIAFARVYLRGRLPRPRQEPDNSTIGF